MKIELSIEKVSGGVIGGAYRVSAWRGGDYLGDQTYLYYSKSEALRQARETVKNYGGLGNYDSRRG